MKNTEKYSAKSIKWQPFAEIFPTLQHDKAYFVCCKRGKVDFYLPTMLLWNRNTACFHEIDKEAEETQDNVFGDMQFAGENNLLMVAEIVLPQMP